jgi:hypothetical protein
VSYPASYQRAAPSYWFHIFLRKPL